MHRITFNWLFVAFLVVGIALGLPGNRKSLAGVAPRGASAVVEGGKTQVSAKTTPVPTERSKTPAKGLLEEERHNLWLVVGATVLVLIVLAGVVIFSWQKKKTGY